MILFSRYQTYMILKLLEFVFLPVVCILTQIQQNKFRLSPERVIYAGFVSSPSLQEGWAVIPSFVFKPRIMEETAGKTLGWVRSHILFLLC
ncbi:CX3C chemokine receptor 1 isoform X2 [Sceloporus undulatus]|uniref:CX3C chemokine receptor 1 isoform X2 n=1 Tax=Sceloporus undulatus TaxID=8520 RepID=UPI001C4B3300|nr:CX3C chemokine receptor 1 isoform X2 [Sceloporus undulatus]